MLFDVRPGKVLCYFFLFPVCTICSQNRKYWGAKTWAFGAQGRHKRQKLCNRAPVRGEKYNTHPKHSIAIRSSKQSRGIDPSANKSNGSSNKRPTQGNFCPRGGRYPPRNRAHAQMFNPSFACQFVPFLAHPAREFPSTLSSLVASAVSCCDHFEWLEHSKASLHALWKGPLWRVQFASTSIFAFPAAIGRFWRRNSSHCLGHRAANRVLTEAAHTTTW